MTIATKRGVKADVGNRVNEVFKLLGDSKKIMSSRRTGVKAKK